MTAGRGIYSRGTRRTQTLAPQQIIDPFYEPSAVKLPERRPKPALGRSLLKSAFRRSAPPVASRFPLQGQGTRVPMDYLLSVPARSRSPDALFASGGEHWKRGRGAPSQDRSAAGKTRDLNGSSHPHLAVFCACVATPASSALE